MSFENPKKIPQTEELEDSGRRSFLRAGAGAAIGAIALGGEVMAAESDVEDLQKIVEELKDWIDQNLVPSLADDHKLDKQLKDIIARDTSEVWLKYDIINALNLVDVAVRMEQNTSEIDFFIDDTPEVRAATIASWTELKRRIENLLQ